MLQRYGQPLLDRAASSQRRVWFRLVTRDIDRHGTIIEPAGVDMTAFRANPVFLWMHDSGGGETTPPPDVVIGRVTNFDQSVDALDIEVEFDDDGDGLAATCFRKVKDGFLRMVSIGCNVLEEETVMVGTHKVPVYTRTELLECSLVIIGSNRGALKLDRSRVAAMLREVGGVGGAVKVADVEAAKAPTVEVAKVEKTTPAPAQRDDKQVATVAVIAPGHMLWGKRRDSGKWTTPGGHLHPGESPVDGAVRELAEESGIIVTADKLKPLGAVTNAKGVRIHTFRLDVPKMITPTVKRDPDKEIEVWEWVPFESGHLPQHILSNLHAQPNAIVAALRLDRAVMGAGGPAVDTLLTTTVYGGDGMDFFGDDDDMLKVRDEDGEEAVSSASSPPASSTSSTSLLSDSSSTSTPETTTSRFATRGVVAHTNYPTVTTAWDASAAVDRWKKWASSDGSGDKEKIDWAKFAKCFLWFDDKAPESFGSYAFPHHDIVDGKPVTVWAGVVAAAARIDQSKGIPAGDIAKMKAHLAEHYKEFDKVAPWQRAAYDMPGGLQRVWQLSASGAMQLTSFADHTDATKQPKAVGLDNTPTPQQAINAEVGALLVESGDVYRLVGVVPHALMFKGPSWTKEAAALWAQKHGYAYFTAYPKDGFIELVILDAGAFRRDAFGVGVKFKTFRLQADPEVSVVVGVLKVKGERALAKLAKGQRGVKASSKAVRQADHLLRSLVSLRLSPSTSAEIAYGIKRSARLIVDKATVRQAERVQRSQAWTFRSLSAALSDDAVTRTLHGDSTGQREAQRIVDEAVARLRQIKALRYSLG